MLCLIYEPSMCVMDGVLIDLLHRRHRFLLSTALLGSHCGGTNENHSRAELMRKQMPQSAAQVNSMAAASRTKLALNHLEHHSAVVCSAASSSRLCPLPLDRH